MEMIYTKQASQSNITSCAQIVYFPSSRHSRDSPVATPTSIDPSPQSQPSRFHFPPPGMWPFFFSASGRRQQTLAAWRAMFAGEEMRAALHLIAMAKIFSTFENVEYPNSKSRARPWWSLHIFNDGHIQNHDDSAHLPANIWC